MDLKSGVPWWPVKDALPGAWPRLEEDLACGVVVVGGGVTGALLAHELSTHGHSVVVLEQREAGWGSTAASTALLQYEIDTYAFELAERYGHEAAALAYRACAAAIPELEERLRGLRGVGFSRCASLYFASRRSHAPALRRECATRAGIGLPVRLLARSEVRARFGIDAECALHTSLAARVDPYLCAWRLLQQAHRQGAAIHDRTRVDAIELRDRGVVVRTACGASVRAGHAILAAGYESQRWLPQAVARNRSSYACVSDPIDPVALGPLARTLVWESARPYLYLRATPDHRLIYGGADDPVDIPARRDARLPRKAAGLTAQVRALFPQLPLVPAFAWAGTFAETPDGLPYFGAHPAHGPRLLFAMAFGGNGITFSMVGAHLLRALLERRRHPLQGLFGFARRPRGKRNC